MSEYQYYEFLAIDRPLTHKQIDEVGQWSTRAKITSTRFVSESDPAASASMRRRYQIEAAAAKGEAEAGGMTGQLLVRATEIQQDRQSRTRAKTGKRNR